MIPVHGTYNDLNDFLCMGVTSETATFTEVGTGDEITGTVDRVEANSKTHADIKIKDSEKIWSLQYDFDTGKGHVVSAANHYE